MKAIRIHTTGGPEVLGVEDVETPKPEDGQVLIQVAAVGVNFTDVTSRQGIYVTPDSALGLPAILGTEVAGVVVGLGEGVSAPAPGTRVAALVRGGYAEYAAADAATTYALPAELDFAAALGFLVQGISAWQLLRDCGRLAPREQVIVHLGADDGGLAIQLAKLFGASTVVATASTAAKRDRATALGADASIDCTSKDWWREALAATGDRGADVILDAVGGDVGEQSLLCLAPFGRLVVYGTSSGRLATFAGSQLMHGNQSVIGYWLGSRMAHEPASAQIVPQLLRIAADGKLSSEIGYAFPLEEAEQAHRAIAAGRTTGKVVLVI